jgi:beta-lactam-binding protein with PASTA domain
MRICPSCGRENADERDFCECGEYLRWEATQFVEAVKPAAQGSSQAAPTADPQSAPDAPSSAPVNGPVDPNLTIAPGAVPAAYPPAARSGGSAAPPPGAPPREEAPPGAAVLLLRLPDDDAANPGPVKANVTPGQRAIILGQIRNESSIVDNYDLSVSGLPEGWWTVTPATAYLVPYGTGGAYEQEVQVHLHPPKSPEAHAKDWPFEVVASSRAYGTQVAGAAATVGVEPYQDVAAKLTPDRASGRLKARFKMTVSNRANAPATVELAGEDQDGECTFRFAEPAVTLPPGGVIEAPFTCFPPSQIWLGRPRDRPIKVSATPAGVEEPQMPPAQGVYRQKPWLPWWLAIVAPIAIALIALFLLTRPKQTTVPNLAKVESVFAAQKLVTAAGLKLSPQVGQVSKPGVQPGSVVDQDPKAGAHVKHGSLVTIQIALGSTSAKVPKVIGLNPVQADQALRASGFVLGTVSPQPPDPNGKIGSQIPGVGDTVAKGTPVAVFLPPTAAALAKAGKKGAAAGAGAGAAAGAGAGAAAAAGGGGSGAAAGGAGGAIAIPAVKGNVLQAASQLSQLGLVPSTVKQLNPATAGTLFGTNPAAGTKVKTGAPVSLLVSAGFPSIAYDDGKSIHVISGATSNPTITVPPGAAPQTEPSWSVDGQNLIYTQGGQLFELAVNQKGAQPRAVSAPGTNFHDPSFAPTRKDNVIAFIDRKGGTGRLCFGTLGPFTLNPDCTSAPGFDLGSQIAWSPDGTAILVFGAKTSDRHVFGLLEFLSNVAFSTHASDWGAGKMVTNDLHQAQGVIAGRWSPDGKQLALAANFGTGDFHLFLTTSNDFMLQSKAAKATPIRACQLSWRSDGKEIAVMQADSPCAAPTGDIGGINPSNPGGLPKPIATNATDPSWQPVSTGG